MNTRQKKIKKTLLMLLGAPFISGFITAMIVFKRPEGIELMGYAGILGIWMIAAFASYVALKGYLLPKE